MQLTGYANINIYIYNMHRETYLFNVSNVSSVSNVSNVSNVSQISLMHLFFLPGLLRGFAPTASPARSLWAIAAKVA
jgi:hypothetical protein